MHHLRQTLGEISKEFMQVPVGGNRLSDLQKCLVLLC
jgi:hypothetical protein